MRAHVPAAHETRRLVEFNCFHGSSDRAIRTKRRTEALRCEECRRSHFRHEQRGDKYSRDCLVEDAAIEREQHRHCHPDQNCVNRTVERHSIEKGAADGWNQQCGNGGKPPEHADDGAGSVHSLRSAATRVSTIALITAGDCIASISSTLN